MGLVCNNMDCSDVISERLALLFFIIWEEVGTYLDIYEDKRVSFVKDVRWKKSRLSLGSGVDPHC